MMDKFLKVWNLQIINLEELPTTLYTLSYYLVYMLNSTMKTSAISQITPGYSPFVLLVIIPCRTSKQTSGLQHGGKIITAEALPEEPFRDVSWINKDEDTEPAN